jgi:N-acetylmuramoyl-L-alanine amidase
MIDFLPKNRFSRPGDRMSRVEGVVIHWVQWPGATAKRVRDYFAEGVPAESRYAGAHYVIGLEGEVIQMIPETEVAYHAGPSGDTLQTTRITLGGLPNWRTVGIELCHPDETGQFTDKTYDAAVRLTRDVCIRYDIEPMSCVLRHHDCTGKDCPLWFVTVPKEWDHFRLEVLHGMKRSVLTR